MPKTDADPRHMQRCQELAEQARLAGNTPVGSLVSVGEEVVAEAAEAVPAGPDPFAHAELVSLRDAMTRLGRKLPPGATLYTTHEPCFLCSFAAREAGVERVVIAQKTPEIGGATSSYPILLADDIERWGPAPTVDWWGG